MRALEFDRLMALLLSGQPRLPGHLFLVSKPKLICSLCLVLQEVTFKSGNNFSLRAATRLGVSDSKF